MARPQLSSADSQIDAITSGRTARLTLAQVRPLVAELMQETVNRLARSGHTMTDGQLRSVAGELTGLDRLLQRLDNRIKTADAITQEISHGR